LQILKKRRYGLVPRVKLLHCANFCPHRTCRIRMTSQNVISGSNFDLWPLRARSNLQILKNAVMSLFTGSSCFTMPIFVHIGLAGSEWQAKAWIRGKIRSNFDLWPLRARSTLQILKNAVTGLFPGSSCFTVPIFVYIGLAGSEWQVKNVISGQK
jgi:hypothetical protein